MQGNELHRWHANHEEVWPEMGFDSESEKWHYWRRVHLLEDGGLLAIFEGVGLVRLDRDSRVLWAHREGEHHDLCVDSRGRIYVLAPACTTPFPARRPAGRRAPARSLAL